MKNGKMSLMTIIGLILLGLIILVAFQGCISVH